MIDTLHKKRLMNATIARARCIESGSVWGIEYWAKVVISLINIEKATQ